MEQVRFTCPETVPPKEQKGIGSPSSKSLVRGTYCKGDKKRSQLVVTSKMLRSVYPVITMPCTVGYDSCMTEDPKKNIKERSELQTSHHCEACRYVSNRKYSCYHDFSGVSLSSDSAQHGYHEFSEVSLSSDSNQQYSSARLSQPNCSGGNFRNPYDAPVSNSQPRKFKFKKGFIHRFRRWRPRKIFIGNADQWSVSTMEYPDVYPKSLNITSGRF